MVRDQMYYAKFSYTASASSSLNFGVEKDGIFCMARREEVRPDRIIAKAMATISNAVRQEKPPFITPKLRLEEALVP